MYICAIGKTLSVLLTMHVGKCAARIYTHTRWHQKNFGCRYVERERKMTGLCVLAYCTFPLLRAFVQFIPFFFSFALLALVVLYICSPIYWKNLVITCVRVKFAEKIYIDLDWSFVYKGIIFMGYSIAIYDL